MELASNIRGIALPSVGPFFPLGSFGSNSEREETDRMTSSQILRGSSRTFDGEWLLEAVLGMMYD
jgi:hypothetical protein